MTAPTYIYTRIYFDTENPKKLKFYTGITKNMNRRQLEHKNNTSRTTRRYNKSYYLSEIRYCLLQNKKYEKTFRKYNIKKKLKIIKSWRVWAR